LDAERNRVLLVDSPNEIVAVDLDAGLRSIFSSDSFPDTLNIVDDPRCIFYDESFGYYFVGNDDTASIIAVDVITGERVYMSRADNPSL